MARKHDRAWRRVGEEVRELKEQRDDLLAALQVVLDQADYTVGNCRPSDMVGAVLSHDVIAQARAAIAKARGQED